MKLKDNLNCRNLPKIMELLRDKEVLEQYEAAKVLEGQALEYLNNVAQAKRATKFHNALVDAGLPIMRPHAVPSNADEEWENEEWDEASSKFLPRLEYTTTLEVAEYLQGMAHVNAIPEIVEGENFPLLTGLHYMTLGHSPETVEGRLKQDFKDLELAPVVELTGSESFLPSRNITLHDTFVAIEDIKNVLHKMSAAVSNTGGLNDNDIEFLAGVCSTLFAANSAFPGKAILAVMRSVSNRMFRGKPVSESCIKVCATFLVRFLEQNLDVRGVAKADIMSFAKTAKGLGLDVAGLEWLLSKPEKLANGIDLQDL